MITNKIKIKIISTFFNKKYVRFTLYIYNIYKNEWINNNYTDL